MTNERIAEHPVDPIFLERWSPRAFDGSEMPEADLLTMIEAARWAPSAYNAQPWRFAYALRGGADWQTFVSLLNPFNVTWADQASALIVLVSDTVMSNPENGTEAPSHYHTFDAGAAWAQLALQASMMGYQAHAMAGVDFDQAREVLNVNDRYKVEVGVAIGKQGDPAALNPALQQREQPSDRTRLAELAFAGRFPG